MEILRATSNSVLWLLDYNAETNARLRAAAEARGVPAARLVFAQKIANPHHLARYPLADLFLDTIPYGAHTTASDALWMGVPVLTLSGRSFAARVCGSLVRAAGAPELVCESAAHFVARAIQLAADRVSLGDIRRRLIAGRESCTLFDIDNLARKLEALYTEMAAEYRAGATPEPNLANLGAYRYRRKLRSRHARDRPHARLSRALSQRTRTPPPPQTAYRRSAFVERGRRRTCRNHPRGVRAAIAFSQ